ncbi:DUF1640 domain-containing protein [Candidatus Thiodictyon syntrophicum]|jgi:DNA anti-recombination protein RmuC|uniref:DUF1640 domain-containing protein n=1 Tax=Candidatus Thiodictyon syntrophicum TaxID=1166950 RepID=A0A2K8UFU9_9GAMM|nr:DUF1640 domain-containing protein [Candidatus Thiodictyon syntrophicum]AUB84426.1 DUF1640 domain-containing protein [Candidatus Thiodictyon syntrophicum]
MGSVVELYEALASAPDERARARLIAAAFERLEERYPHLPDLVTHQQLRETELRLQQEIMQVRADLSLQIEQLRGEQRETELRLRKEIEQLRGEVTTAIERSRNTLLMWLIPLMFAQVGALAALVKLL